MKRNSLILILFLLLISVPPKNHLLEVNVVAETSNSSCEVDRNQTWTIGLIYCTEGMKSGYTLFSPMASDTTYLINEYGEMVHSWTSNNGYKPGLSAYLLDDGDLLRTANLGNNQPGEFTGGGSAGKVERISWDGDLEWSWIYSSDSYRSHHDIEPLSNGNFLMIAWEYRNETEVAEAGRDPNDSSSKALGTTSIWPDQIIEVKPIGVDDAEIVWEWHFWDHLIQDYDSSKENYGIVSQHPELLDINFMDANGGASGGRDWLHCNGIDYNPTLDYIAISCKNTNEIYIIDHSTTTAEAAGHTGGNSGMGGDILYRYGNPESYKRGDSEDQVLFGQHDVRWIEEGFPDAGKLMIFNNGNGRDILYSSVDVIDPQMNGWNYQINDSEPFGPSSLSWSWDIGTDMYSDKISGATRLSNGNTLITFGVEGTLIEVDYEGRIVWKYISPVNNLGIMTQGDSIFEGNGNKVFKVSRFDSTHPGLKDKTLTPIDYIENWEDMCPDEDSLPYDSDGDGCIDDSDGDGVKDNLDICHGFDDLIDVDLDGIPDDCDELIDSDNDGVADSSDLCNGHDDNIDTDNDQIPDECDDIIDSDNDGIADGDDQCEGHNDSIDFDLDGVPDGCDQLIDSDGDGVSNSEDLCEGHNDSIDFDNDSIPDDCDAIIDADGDGVSDDMDNCSGGDDTIDIDEDGIPDFCDDKIDDGNSNESENSIEDSASYLKEYGSYFVFIILLAFVTSFLLLARRKTSG